jgi:hypothetical protein
VKRFSPGRRVNLGTGHKPQAPARGPAIPSLALRACIQAPSASAGTTHPVAGAPGLCAVAFVTQIARPAVWC